MAGNKHQHRLRSILDPKKHVSEAKQEASHDEKWAMLDASHAAFARRAIVRADEIRTEKTDPGDAYLQGVADLRAYQIRQQLIDSFKKPDYIQE